MPFFIFLVAALMFFPSVTFAQYYRWVDENGVTHFSEDSPGPGAVQHRHKDVPVIRSVDRPSVVTSKSDVPRVSQPSIDSYEARRQRELEEYEKEQLAQTCQRYRKRIDRLDGMLRSGYTAQRGKRLRAERREISSKLTWECLRN